MDTYSKIANLLQELCHNGSISSQMSFFAKIVSVESDTTCTVQVDELRLTGVRLRSVVNREETGILITPKVGSYVLVSDLSGGDMRVLAISMYSEVDKITLNGGKNGGLINIQDLVDKLNAVENDLNNLKTVFKGWEPAPNDGGALLKTAATTWANKSITKTQVKDIEDTSIVH